MIGISATTQNTAGALIIHELRETKFYDDAVRVERTATLDGGCVINHGGFCQGDRTFDVRAKLTEEEGALLRALHRTETLVNVATEDGYFSAVISDLATDNGEVRMSIIIKEKLNT